MFILAWVALMLAVAAAQAQPAPAMDRATLDSVGAIAAEARQRIGSKTPVTQPWRTLDRERLARLLGRPELAEGAGREEVNLLIDQAGAWDLLRFERPSDVLAAWQRWRPDDPDLKPVASGSTHRHLARHVFYADASYSDESGAFMALWRCLPAPAWRVWHTEPMLWALEQGTGWDQPNLFDFGRCVYTQSETGGSPFGNVPDSARGRRSAGVLERKLSAHLLQAGCSRRGPDDCLTLLHGLVSLSPRQPDLPRIVATMAPHFQPQPAAALPPALRARRGALDDTESAAALRARRDLMRQALFIDAALTVMRHQPGSLAQGEPARSLQRLLDLTLELARLDFIQALQAQPRFSSDHRFPDPWGALGAAAAAAPAWRSALHEAGATAAAGPGCELPERLAGSRITLPPALWLGYATQKLLREGQSCGAIDLSGLAQAYAHASDPANDRAALEPLRKLLGDETRAGAHAELVAALGAGCPLATDPWRVCDWVGNPADPRFGTLQRRLPLREADRFVSNRLTADTDAKPAPERQLGLLLERVRALRPRAEAQVAARLAELQRQGTPLADSLWTHPRHPLLAVLLRIEPGALPEGSPPHGLEGVARNGRVLLIFGHTQASLVRVPGGWGQYDDGGLAALSDIDGDLRLEAWFSGEFGECDGEEEDPGQTCAIETFSFGGEVFGSELVPFVQGSR